MNFFPECVITGADLFVPQEQKWVHGDLHRVGGAYVFNACVTEAGNPAWTYGRPDTHRLIVSIRDAAYFERRAVIVFAAETADFNDAATEYMKPGFTPSGRATAARFLR